MAYPAVSTTLPKGRVAKASYKASIIGFYRPYKSVAYPAVSTTLPKGYGFCTLVSSSVVSMKKKKKPTIYQNHPKLK